jgi:hypothetical protein
MDTSPEYVKMCDCQEIQGVWDIGYGDWYADRTDRSIDLQCDWQFFSARAREKFRAENIWLPKQDQLQEMVDWKAMRLIIEWASLSNRFEWWADNPFSVTTLDYRDRVESLEQAWLRLVMHEKYGKHWTGEAWA